MDNTEIKFKLPGSTEKRLRDKNTPYVFARNAQKSNVYNGPLLVIGLGGSGYDALSRAKEKMVNCFKMDKKGELKGIEFLEIDTDDRDMKKCLEAPTFWGLKADEFKIFQNADIGAILRARNTGADVLPEEIAEWLDPNIPVAQIVHGAAGIRQAGRLLLHLNAVEIIDVIKEKLDKIRQSVTLSKNPVNVVIFTGIGGGTGSGVFVDIAYIVRQCIKEFSGQAFITGIMLMPDILSGDPNVDKITKENIKRNGFAALKELDHLMNLSETKDTFIQKFPGGFVVEETEEAIFDRCVLVSSMVEGRLLLPNAKEHAYNIAAEMLIDMISNSSIVSKGSNDISRRDAALTNMKNRKPANYVYTAVGGQAVYVDFDLVFNLFVKQVLDYDVNMTFTQEQVNAEVDKIWKNEQIEEAINWLVVDQNNFPVEGRDLYELYYEEINASGETEKKPVNKEYIRKNYDRKYVPTEKTERRKAYDEELKVLQRTAERLLQKLGEIYSKIESQYDDRYIDLLKNKIQVALNERKSKVEPETEQSKLQEYTKELEDYRCYFENKDRKNKKNKKKKRDIRWPSKPPKLEEVSAALSKISNEQAAIIKVEVYNNIIAELIKNIGEIFSVKDKDEKDRKISHELISFYSEARSKWNDLLKAKYDIEYSTPELNAGNSFVQESLEKLWEKNDSLIGKTSIVSRIGDVDVDFRDISVIGYINTIENIIKEEHRVLIDEAAREYRKKMTDNSLTGLYQGDTGLSPDITTGQIFEKIFEKVRISLDDIIKGLFDIEKPELKDVWKEVVKAILNHSGVLYSKKAMKDGEVFERPSYNEFMIPKNNEMLAEVCKEITGQEAEESEISNRISCMKYTQCQKIDDYIYIDELERVYNQSNSKCGLHLYENGETRWAKLPSPVYRNGKLDYIMKDRYEDSKISEKYRYVFFRALQDKLIKYSEDTKKYYIDGASLEKKLNEKKIEGYLNPGNIDICTLEYNESKNLEDYKLYCADWFVKMFYYRDLVAKALDIKFADIEDEMLKKEVYEKYES